MTNPEEKYERMRRIKQKHLNRAGDAGVLPEGFFEKSEYESPNAYKAQYPE